MLANSGTLRSNVVDTFAGVAIVISSILFQNEETRPLVPVRAR
jgi:hypothetical protein